MSNQPQERQVNIRGEILIDGPARLVGSFTGTIVEGRIVTSGNVTIGSDADVHASVEPDHVAIEPGEASLTYVPAPVRERDELASESHEPEAEERRPDPEIREAISRPVSDPPQVTFPKDQPRVPQARPVRASTDDEDTAAKQARARLAAYSRKAATGTDDPSGWAAS